MIVDLSGLPASGKSYFSKKFCIEFKKQTDKKMIDFIQWDRTTFFGRVWHTIMYPIIRHTRKYRRLLVLFNDTKKNCPRYNVAHTASFFATRIVFLKFNYWLANYIHLNLLVNEGISQSLVVFAVEFDLSEKQFFYLVDNVLQLDNIKFGVYQIQFDQCITSFITRDRHVTMIDELRGAELTLFLTTFNKYLIIYLRNYNFIPLSRNKSFKENFKLLKEGGQR